MQNVKSLMWKSADIEAPGDTIFGGVSITLSCNLLISGPDTLFTLPQQKAAFEDVCGIKLGYKMRLYGFAGCEHGLCLLHIDKNDWAAD